MKPIHYYSVTEIYSNSKINTDFDILIKVVGLGLMLSSIVFLVQVVSYQNPGLLYDGYPPYSGTAYRSASYNLFGYQFDPIIAIASVGIAIGAFQFLGSFALCCTDRVSQ